MGRMAAILDKARGLGLAVVIDGDGLWHLQQHHSILQVKVLFCKVRINTEQRI